MTATKDERQEIRTLYRMGAKQNKLCDAYDVSRSTVCRIVKGATRDLRDDRIRKLWRDGESLENIALYGQQLRGLRMAEGFESQCVTTAARSLSNASLPRACTVDMSASVGG